MVGGRLACSFFRRQADGICSVSGQKKALPQLFGNGSFKMSPPDPLVFHSDYKGDWWEGGSGTGC